MIDRSTIDRIFAAADIAEVVGEFVTLKKKGVNYTACCPFHNEKTPSFIVSPAKGLFKCFGCGKGGNAVSFVMEHEKLTYPDALRWMARKYNIEIAEKEQTAQDIEANNDRESMLVVNSFAAEWFAEQLRTPSGESIAVSYFRERGFSDATIAKFNLGYSPDGGDTFTKAALKAGYQERFLEKTGLTILRESGGYYDRFNGRVIFPVHSLSGRVIAFGGRTLRNDKKSAKYLNSPESEVYHKSNSLYGIYHAKRAISQLDRCILVEGYTDVIQMHQSGMENVVASSGTSLTEEQIKLIKRFTNNVTVIYDGDAAGIKASLRGIDMILAQGLAVRVVLLPDGEDPDSFARSRNASQLSEFIARGEEDFISFKTRLLLADAKSDPIRRAELINDIIESIAVIPDTINRTVFIRECSRMMEIDEDILSREVSRKRAYAKDGKAGREAMQASQRKEDFLKKQSTETQLSDLSRADSSIVRELAVLEFELLGYMMKYGNEKFDFEVSPSEILSLGVAETIIGDLEMDSIEFFDPFLNGIYGEIAAFFHQHGCTPHIHYFVNHADENVASFTVDMLTAEDAHHASAMWERYEIHVSTERERLSEAIPKAITIYKSKVIGHRIESLSRHLSTLTEFTEEVGDIYKHINQLNQLRTDICDRYMRTT